MEEIELIVGNSNRRFSGVTASMLSTLPGIAHRIKLAVLGSHFIPDSIPTLSYREFLSTCRKPLPHGGQRAFHARRRVRFFGERRLRRSGPLAVDLPLGVL